MTMKKSLIFALTAGVLFACGDKEEDTGTEQEAEEAEETEEAEEVSEGEDSGSSEDPDTGAE